MDLEEISRRIDAGENPDAMRLALAEIAPEVGGAKLADGTMPAADGQLAGTPSVICDAIAVDSGGRALLTGANIVPDAGVVGANDHAAFIAAAKTRQWDREKFVRTLVWAADAR